LIALTELGTCRIGPVSVAMPAATASSPTADGSVSVTISP
jgi:hypothetical protein